MPKKVKFHKVGRRKAATAKRKAREREEEATRKDEIASERARLAEREAEARSMHGKALSAKGLLGMSLKETLNRGSAGADDEDERKSKRKSGDMDDAAVTKAAYSKLLNMLPQKRMNLAAAAEEETAVEDEPAASAVGGRKRKAAEHETGHDDSSKARQAKRPRAEDEEHEAGGRPASGSAAIDESEETSGAGVPGQHAATADYFRRRYVLTPQKLFPQVTAPASSRSSSGPAEGAAGDIRTAATITAGTFVPVACLPSLKLSPEQLGVAKEDAATALQLLVSGAAAALAPQRGDETDPASGSGSGVHPHPLSYLSTLASPEADLEALKKLFAAATAAARKALESNSKDTAAAEAAAKAVVTSPPANLGLPRFDGSRFILGAGHPPPLSSPSALPLSMAGGCGSGLGPLDLEHGYHVRPKLCSAWNESYGLETHRLAVEAARKVQRAYKREVQRLSLAAADETAAANSKSAVAAQAAVAAASAASSALRIAPSKGMYPFTPLQYALWGAVAAYRDVYFAARSHDNARELRTVTALHVLNHVWRARDLVAKNQAKLRAEAAAARLAKLEKATALGKKLDAAGTTGGSKGAAGSGAAGNKKKTLLEIAEEKAAATSAAASSSALLVDEAALLEAGDGDDGFGDFFNGAGAGSSKKKPAIQPPAAAKKEGGRKLLDDDEDEGDEDSKQAFARRALGGAGEGLADSGNAEEDGHDSGFTRPRVLVLLPFRHSALQWVRSLLRLLPGRTVHNRNRFFKEFSEEGSGLGGGDDGEGADDDDEDQLAAALKAKAAGNVAGLSPAQLATLSRQDRQMMSDIEEEDDDDEAEADGRKAGDSDDDSEDGEGGGRNKPSSSSSSSSSYLYNRSRQGWSAKALAAAKAARKAEALAAANGEDDSEEDESEDEEDDDAADPDAGPLSALAQSAGRRKVDDRIVKDGDVKFDGRGRRIKRKRKPKRSKRSKSGRGGGEGGGGAGGAPHKDPLDYRRMLAGNIDDDFKVGISLGGRKSVKLYADFYSADILVASPMGLRRLIGGEGDKRREYDFLSSIEILVLDGADILAQQNWQHVRDIMAVVNAQPKSTKHVDFARVREVFLEGRASELRQTLCYSSHMTPDITALVRKGCKNSGLVPGLSSSTEVGGGGLLLRCLYEGTITRVVPTVRQVFQRIPAALASEADDARFRYFKDTVLPELMAGISSEAGNVFSHTLIYCPQYYDYVRLRNLLDSKEVEFVTCSEYSEDADVTRARTRFFAGHSPVLLTTERFYFFRRLKIRGARHVFFYGPPTVGHFYPEVVNSLEESASKGYPISVTALYTPFDAAALERVVGSERAVRMLQEGAKSSHHFV